MYERTNPEAGAPPPSVAWVRSLSLSSPSSFGFGFGRMYDVLSFVLFALDLEGNHLRLGKLPLTREHGHRRIKPRDPSPKHVGLGNINAISLYYAFLFLRIRILIDIYTGMGQPISVIWEGREL